MRPPRRAPWRGGLRGAARAAPGPPLTGAAPPPAPSLGPAPGADAETVLVVVRPRGACAARAARAAPLGLSVARNPPSPFTHAPPRRPAPPQTGDAGQLLFSLSSGAAVAKALVDGGLVAWPASAVRPRAPPAVVPPSLLRCVPACAHTPPPPRPARAASRRRARPPPPRDRGAGARRAAPVGPSPTFRAPPFLTARRPAPPPHPRSRWSPATTAGG